VKSRDRKKNKGQISIVKLKLFLTLHSQPINIVVYNVPN